MEEGSISDSLREMQRYCETNSKHYKRCGRAYYTLTYLLSVLTVLASITAGVLAIWLDTDAEQELIGTIALIPAASASVASQLKLTDKANWFYNFRTQYCTLSRDFASIIAAGATQAQADQLRERLNKLEVQADRAWSERLAFFFDQS